MFSKTDCQAVARIHSWWDHQVRGGKEMRKSYSVELPGREEYRD